MAGNSFGEVFQITTFGESHGPGLGVVIDGVPPCLPLSVEDIQTDLNRRRPGQSSVTSPRQESDTVEILSGIFDGKTTGTPLTLFIHNRDHRSSDYSKIRHVFRPGHADFTYQMKYGVRDFRGGGRSSGRETVCRVAAGAVAKKILQAAGIRIIAYTKAVGDIISQTTDYDVIERNIVRSADMLAAEKMVQKIEDVCAQGDSIGGIIEAVIIGCPVGLGDPVFDKLNARLAHAIMSIGAMRGIEFGAGFGAARLRGSENNDLFEVREGQIRTKTNHAGGILGGISTGEDIVFRVAVKPPSSITKIQPTVTDQLTKTEIQVEGRHDPCLCPRVVPVIEAMSAITIVDFLLIQKVLNA